MKKSEAYWEKALLFLGHRLPDLNAPGAKDPFHTAVDDETRQFGVMLFPGLVVFFTYPPIYAWLHYICMLQCMVIACTKMLS